MSEEGGMTLIERLYSGVNGELFFDPVRKMNYNVEEVFGDPLNLGSVTVFARYENGKTKFLCVADHINDVIVGNTSDLEIKADHVEIAA
jgi:hypothetical protein